VSAYQCLGCCWSGIDCGITGEANRLLSLDLSSLGDGSQLPGRASITNSGQGSTNRSSFCPAHLRFILTICNFYADSFIMNMRKNHQITIDWASVALWQSARLSCRGSRVQSPASAYQRFTSRAHIQSVGAEWTCKNLCLRTNVWVAAAQALVAAITSEANRLLRLDIAEGPEFNPGLGISEIYFSSPYSPSVHCVL
jgi:hypothetical protein